jgi:hypothetical protein
LFTPEEYAQANKVIRNSCEKIILRSPHIDFFLASSGAVGEFSQMENRDLSYQFYAETKSADEQSFSRAIGEMGGKIGICRIYSVTGSELLNPSEFAISNLVLQALQGSEIRINSSRRVLRKYVDAKDLFRVNFARLAKESFLMESGGELIDLVDLGQLITKKFNPSAAVLTDGALSSAIVDEYYSHSSEFEEIASEFNIDLLSVDKQLDNVFTAVQRFLKSNQ